MSKKPKMVLCRNCNTPIPKKAKICPSCGAKNKKPFYKRFWFILLVIIVAFGTFSSVKRHKNEKYDWNEVELSNRLPKPESDVGRILSNTSDYLSMEVEMASKGEYKEYAKECQSMGYTIESEDSGDSYKAFDQDGYELSLNFYNESMDIKLDAPIEMETLNWPKSEIASLLPMPKSTVGKVSTDTADGCYIYVGETTIDDFNAYADECLNSGFSVDYERGDKFYKAKDESGNKLSLSYLGNNVIDIKVTKPDEVKPDGTTPETDNEAPSEAEQEESTEEATEEAVETEEQSSDTSNLIDGMRPEFKQAMDSYEAFMNEYCDFMKKYEESDGTDLGLLADYTEYMSKYAKVVEDFEAWDSEEMNMAETAYYLDVQTRISKKLLEVAE